MDRRLLAGHRIAWGVIRRGLGKSCATVSFDSGRSRIVADLDTSLGRGLYRYPGYWQRDFDLLNELRPGDVFVDCGANIGLFTLVAAHRVGSAGQVIAFEPAPKTREALTRNIEVSGHMNVTVMPHALSDTPGESPFIVMGESGGLSSFAPDDARIGHSVRVPVATLDAILPDEAWGHIRMVKIDVEGAELRALRGAARLLTAERPMLLIEIEDAHLRRQGSSADEVFALLSDAGYDGLPTEGPGPNYLFRSRQK